MKKLNLDLEDLQVDSFAPDQGDLQDGGTVVGQEEDVIHQAITAPYCSLPICLPTGICQSINYCPTWEFGCGTDSGTDCIA